VAEVKRYKNPQYVNHVILLTDGRTYGDEQECYDLAKTAASQGIGISGMGLGSEWNDIFLDQLANITGASTVFVQQPQDIERFLKEKLTNLSRAFAQNVDFSCQLSPGVTIEYAFRIQPEAGALPYQEPIHFGQVFFDEPLKVLLEIGIQSDFKKRSSLDLLTGQLGATILSAHVPAPEIPIQITVQVRDDEPTSTPPASILQALSRVTLYRMQDKARSALSNGDYEKATRHLQHLATHLLAQGENELAKTILLEAEHIERQKAFTESGEKQIKYGTRSLLMPGERIS
jgi:Ca-activated chloride channel family protein